MDAHLSRTDIEARLDELGASPADCGKLEMILCRPQINERQSLQRAELDTAHGLVGDTWLSRGSRHTADGSAHPDMQITIMNSRTIQAIAGHRSDWMMAGDQLFVDLDLSEDNLPAGQRLAIGTAVVEVTGRPHTGCAKFSARYGAEALKFVNSPETRHLRRRGLNARVIQSGTISVGDSVTKIGAG